MNSPRAVPNSLSCVIALMVATTVWPPPSVCAQQLSIRHYDVSDGLANSHIAAIYQDAKGYIWLATWEGLSPFSRLALQTVYCVSSQSGDLLIGDQLSTHLDGSMLAFHSNRDVNYEIGFDELSVRRLEVCD